jgi:hypothetical protein
LIGEKIMIFKVSNTQPVANWEDINTQKYYYETNNKFVEWLLDKLIKHNLIEKKEYIDRKRRISYQEVSIDTRKLIDFIIEHMNKMRYYNCENVEKILIGGKYLRMMELEVTQSIFINHYEPNGNLSMFCGIPIVLCPYIDGIVFVPKERY